MSWKDELDPVSLRIAMTDASPLRVLAGPGTGKTFTLIRRVARLLEEKVPPKRIFLSTFTRTAADALKRELESLNVKGASSVRATTVHSFCFSILNKNEVLEIIDRVPRPLLEYEKRFLLEDLKNVDADFGSIHKRRERLKAFEAAWARLESDHPGWPNDPIDKQFDQRLRDWLLFHDAMLIGELVPQALRYLRNNPASRERFAFSHILVDEYQDLNPAEQEFIKLLAQDACLTIIGDEDQSIYSFKFARPKGIAEFHRGRPETTDETIDLCRRCPSNIVDMANRLIENNRNRTARKLTPNYANGNGKIKVYQWMNMEQETEGLARIVEDLVKADKVKPGRVLILAPRKQLGYDVRDLLETKGVKAHSFFLEQALDGDPTDIAKSRAQQAFTLLTLAANRKDSVALRCWCGFGSPNLREKAWKRLRALCTADGLGLSAAINSMQNGKLKLTAGHKINERLNLLEDKLQELAPRRGAELFDALFPDNDPYFNQIRAISTGPDSDANAEQLLDRLRTFITQPELPTDVDFVRVMSLHKSKGLTADLVIVMGCIEGLIPNLPKDASEAEHRQILEEQRRLFYVSITRARKMLVLSSVTRLPLKEAYKMGLQVRRRQGHYAETITTRFIDELGPNCPQPTTGVNSSSR